LFDHTLGNRAALRAAHVRPRIRDAALDLELVAAARAAVGVGGHHVLLAASPRQKVSRWFVGCTPSLVASPAEAVNRKVTGGVFLLTGLDKRNARV